MDRKQLDTMKAMNLELSPSQFKTLLKLVYLGNWMANAQRGEGDVDTILEYEDMEDFIFSHTKAFGLGEWVDDELKDEGKYFPSRKFEEESGVRELIDEYDEYSFWDELAECLTDREMLKTYGAETLKSMSRDERFGKYLELREKYDKELEEHGLERIVIG